MAAPAIVGTELVTYDRDSFEVWWPQHLAELLTLVDQLYLRVDSATSGRVLAVLHQFVTTHAIARGRVLVDPQRIEYGRFQEDVERQALLDWALATGAQWVVCLDADEVLEPGGGQALRQLLLSQRATGFRLLKVALRYCSHHQPGFVGPPSAVQPTVAFRLDDIAASYRFKADEDGLHPGRAPYPQINAVLAPELAVIHYHAVSCAEWMGERAFYDGTGEVVRNGGTDFLFRCDRYHREIDVVPLADALEDADWRLERIAEGEGLTA